eukprot:6961779-Heterocapsa_arctica.AAC.1
MALLLARMPAKVRPGLAPAVPVVHPSKGWWWAAEADIWSSRLEDPCHDDEMPLPGGDAGVNVGVEIDVDVEPLSEGV